MNATATLAEITQGDEYFVVPDVPLFDAHDEFDAKGNLKRRFDAKRLKAICDLTNRREQKTGNLAVIQPGHTVDDVPEAMQPPHWGYARSWKVKPFGADNVPTIHADIYCRKTVDDGTGKDVDGAKAIRSMPFPSVELWMKGQDGLPIPGFIDRVAMLRQTPGRDLGHLVYSKATKTTRKESTPKLYRQPSGPGLAASERGGKLFYSMECQMDPTMAADATAPDADMNSKFEAFLNERFPHLQEVYDELAAKFDAPKDAPGGEPPMPGTDLDAPGGDAPMGDAPPPKLDYSKASPKTLANRLQYFEKQLEKAQAEAAAARKEREDEKLAYSKTDAEKYVDRLEQDGYELDRDEEVAYFAKLPIGESRDKRDSYLRRTHRQGVGSSIPPQGMFDITEPQGKQLTTNELNDVLVYMRKNRVGYDEAVAKYKK